MVVACVDVPKRALNEIGLKLHGLNSIVYLYLYIYIYIYIYI